MAIDATSTQLVFIPTNIALGWSWDGGHQDPVPGRRIRGVSPTRESVAVVWYSGGLFGGKAGAEMIGKR